LACASQVGHARCVGYISFYAELQGTHRVQTSAKECGFVAVVNWNTMLQPIHLELFTC